MDILKIYSRTADIPYTTQLSTSRKHPIQHSKQSLILHRRGNPFLIIQLFVMGTHSFSCSRFGPSVIAAAGLQRPAWRPMSVSNTASQSAPDNSLRMEQDRTDSATHPRRCLEPKQEPPKLSPTSRNRKVCSACDGTVKYVRNNVATRTVSSVMFSPRRMCAKCSSSARVPPATSPTSLASSWATFCNCCAQCTARNESRQTISTQVSIYPTRVMCI